METFKIGAYLEAIERIESQEMLLQMNVSDYPHMNNKGRDRFYREISKKAFPELEKTHVTTDQMVAMLGRVING